VSVQAIAPVLAVLQGLSLGNLCLANVWYHVLDASPARYYALDGPASRARMLAALANLVSLGALFAAALLSPGPVGVAPRLVQLGLVLLLLLEGAVLYRTAYDHLRPICRTVRELLRTPGRRRVARAAVAFFAMAFGVWAARHPLASMLDRVISALAYAALPLLVWTVGRTVWFIGVGHPVAPLIASASATRMHAHTPRASAAVGRVVWLIFDELDYGLAFDRRPAGLELPNFDRLVAQSLACGHAFPPAHCTELSMPALISGLAVAGTWPQHPSELLIALRGPGQESFVAEDSRLERVLWSRQSTVFSKARALGARTALVGWYHPYARIIGSHLDWCTWHEDPEPPFAVRRTFWGAYSDHLRGLFETGRYSLFGQSLTVKKAARQHEAIRRDATRLIASAEAFDLVLVHWPLPHAPFFHDSRRGRHSAANRGPAGYVDHLALADRMLGELLGALDAADREKPSTLVVSSDHWWRASASYDGRVDHRVPFIVRLPGATGPARWDARFETRLTGDLILELLAGRICGYEELRGWLAGRAVADAPNGIVATDVRDRPTAAPVLS
jgi:hypothetical protein